MWILNVLFLELILCIVLVSQEIEAYDLIQNAPECYFAKK